MTNLSAGPEANCITLACGECGYAIPLPADEVTAVVCPLCKALRRIRWFAGPRMWERFAMWSVFGERAVR
jgi:hypothetical protein